MPSKVSWAPGSSTADTYEPSATIDRTWLVASATSHSACLQQMDFDSAELQLLERRRSPVASYLSSAPALAPSCLAVVQLAFEVAWTQSD